MASNVKDIAVQRKVQYLERVVGSALLEGADKADIENYLTTEGGVLQPAVIFQSAARRRVLPKLGEGEIKALGGRDAFRALFGLKPADEPLAPTLGKVAGVEFELDKTGSPDATSQNNVRAALTACGYTLQYDAFACVVLVTKGGQKLAYDDAVVQRAWLEVDAAYGFRPSLQFFEIVVQDTAHLSPVHPVLDYLDNLPDWDGVPRLDTWLTDFGGAVDSPYTRAVGCLPLVAAVRRVKNPHGVKFDELLVLVGKQGLGKSKLFAMLSPKAEWFTDGMAMGDEPKIAIERSRGIWISEIPELQGSPRETERIKAYLSRSVDGPARMAYSKLPVRVARQFVNFGTTNDPRFLRDPTGNRRFWPVPVTLVRPDALLAIRDQLWAEAILREAQGASLHLDQDLWAAATEVQEEHREVDPWEDLIEDAIDCTKPAVPVSSCWAAIGSADAGKQDVRAARRVADIMHRFGFPMKKMLRVSMPDGSSKAVRCWVKDKNQGGVDFPNGLGGGTLPF